MYTQRTVRIRTKNFTANPLRKSILVPFLAVARLGSLTSTSAIFPGKRNVVECNSTESILNSRDKIRMKECFTRANIPQAEMYHGKFDIAAIKNHFGISKNEEYHLVGKAICGFQGKGMVLIENDKDLADFCHTHTPLYFYIELFYNYGREYRIHATRNKVFLSWRKLRKNDAIERWFFNSQNCNWIGEDHTLFDKPSNWRELCDVASRAISSTGLDIGAVDIRVSNQDTSKFIVCEVNSAPALGDAGIEAYRTEIRNILIQKHKNNEL